MSDVIHIYHIGNLNVKYFSYLAFNVKYWQKLASLLVNRCKYDFVGYVVCVVFCDS